MSKMRLDALMINRALAKSRARAQSLIMAGQVRVDGQVILKPATSVSPTVSIEIEMGPRYVSRGGEKLEAALQAFGFNKDNLSSTVCADVGASSGGFTDCLLQHGVLRVYAIDVGQGILEWKIRQDKRVVVMEGVNARHIDKLPEPVDLVTVDVSFISLKIILPVIMGWFEARGGDVVALIKPQFEAGRKETSRGKGVIRDPKIHRQVLLDILTFAQGKGYSIDGLIRSPLSGQKGNIEFLTHLIYPGKSTRNLDDLLTELGLSGEISQGGN